MEQITTTPFTHADDCSTADVNDPHHCDCAVREMGWVARQARVLTSKQGPGDQALWDEFTARKTALLVYIESNRGPDHD